MSLTASWVASPEAAGVFAFFSCSLCMCWISLRAWANSAVVPIMFDPVTEFVTPPRRQHGSGRRLGVPRPRALAADLGGQSPAPDPLRW